MIPKGAIMTDPISDTLSRIRNGYLAGKKTVSCPHSRVKEKLVKVLVKEGFLGKVEVQGKKPAEKKINLFLKYDQGRPVVTGIKRISKPGLRVYARAGKIPPIRLGYGVTVISTSSGIMTGKEANKKNLGGEIICQVW